MDAPGMPGRSTPITEPTDRETGLSGPGGRRGTHVPWMVAALTLGAALRLLGWILLRRAFFCGAPGFEDAVHQGRILGLLQTRFAEAALPAGSPFYPYLGALLSLITGGSTGGLLLAQSLAGLLTVPLVAWAFAPLLSPRSRWIAALIYAVHPVFVFYGMRLQPVVFAIPLLLVASRLVLLSWEPQPSRTFWGGLVLGLGFLLKPFAFFAAAVAGAVRHLIAPASGRKRGMVLAGVLLLGFVLLPTLLCAYHTTLPNSGPTWNWTDALGFYQALQPPTWGTARTGTLPGWKPFDQAQSDANEAMRRELTPWETAVFYRGRALQTLFENPIRFVGQVLRRALLLVSRPEIPDPASLRFVLWRHAVPLVWGLYLFPLLLALAAVGAWRRRGGREFAALAPLLLAMLALNLLGTYSSVTRAFFLVALLPLVVWGLEAIPALLREWRTSRPARIALAGGLSLLILSVADLPGGARRFENESEDLREAAGLLLRGAQDRRGATQLLRKAIQQDPGNPAAHADLAGLLALEELPEAARQEYQTALRLAPDYPAALYGLAEAYRAASRYAEAESVMTRLVTLHSNHPLYLNQLATIQIMRGRFGEARLLLRRALEISPLYQVALINLRAADEGERRATSLAFPDSMTPAPDSELMQLSVRATNAWRAKQVATADSLSALALARFPSEPMAWYVRGMFLYQLKRHLEAAELLTRVVRAVPGRAMTTRTAAEAWRAAGRPERASALVRESLERAADDANRASLERLLEETQTSGVR